MTMLSVVPKLMASHFYLTESRQQAYVSVMMSISSWTLFKSEEREASKERRIGKSESAYRQPLLAFTCPTRSAPFLRSPMVRY